MTIHNILRMLNFNTRKNVKSCWQNKEALKLKVLLLQYNRFHTAASLVD